jgi:hypothetical protein
LGQLELKAAGRTVYRLDVILEDGEFVLGRSLDAALP